MYRNFTSVKCYRAARFVLVHFLSFLLVFGNFQAACAASITPDSRASGGLNMGKAANGVPVVNINNPNGAGVSHNKFTDFNVGNRGLVINNSKHNMTSQLGGVVLGNSNLNNSARAIINEVTSGRRSHINGVQEILGGRADYILANPNGISINGGGFINAHRATLTTGQIVLGSSGELEKLLIKKGDIEFLGKELNISNLDYFGVIARVAKINAQVNANSNQDSRTEIAIVTGAGEYDAKNAKLYSETAGGNKSTISIDSSNLGGLYAGKITIISNENGLGVNIPAAASCSGDISITANGKLVHSNLNSAGKINVSSKASKIVAKEKAQIRAKSGINYKAAENIELQKDSLVRAKNGLVNLHSETGAIENEGKIFALGAEGLNINSDSLINSGRIFAKNGVISIKTASNIANIGIIECNNEQVTLDAGGDLTNSGRIFSLQEMTINSGDELINQASGQIVTQFTLRLKGDGGISNVGNISAQELIDITSGSGFKNIGTIDGSADFKINAAADITNKGTIKAAKTLAFSTDENLINRDYITAKNLFFRAGAALTNKQLGKIVAQDLIRLDITGDTINQGQILATNKTFVLNSVSGGLENSGVIGAPDVKIKVRDNIDNSDHIRANILDIESVAGSLTNSGTIISKKDSSVIKLARDLSNSGYIESENNLDVTARNFINSGTFLVKQDIDYQLRGNLENRGDIISLKAVRIIADNDIENLGAGRIESSDDLSIVSNRGAVINRSQPDQALNAGIISFKGLEIKAATGVVNEQNTIQATNDLSIITAGILSNIDSTIIADGAANLLVDGAVLNQGLIQSNNKLLIKGSLPGSLSGDVTNEGRLNSDDDIVIESKGTIDNQNVIDALKSINFKADGDITNSGTLDASDVLQIRGKSKINNSGTIKSADQVDIIAEDNITNLNGIITSEQDMNITSNKGKLINRNTDPVLYQDSKIISSANLTIKAEDGIENDKNHIESKNNLTFVTKGDLDNKLGNILAAQDLKLAIVGTVNNSGNIQSGADMKLGGIDIDVEKARSFINFGSISAGNELDFQVTDSSESSNLIQANKQLNIAVVNGGLFNKGANSIILSQSDALTITTHGDVTNEGALDASLNVKLESSAGSIVSSNKIFSQNGKVTLLADKQIKNNGNIESKIQEIQITAGGNIENNGAIDANQDVTVTSANGSITNNNKIHSKNGALTVHADKDVINTGKILADDGSLLIQSTTESISNIGADAKIISYADQLDINAQKDIINTGALQSNQDMIIRSASGDFKNTDGKILSGRKVTIEARNIDNESTDLDDDAKGRIQAATELTIRASGALNNSGIIIADTGSVTANGKLHNKGNIELTNGGTITSGADDIENEHLLKSSNNKLTLTAAKKIVNKGSGEIDVLSLDINAAEGISNEAAAQIKSTGTIEILSTAGLDNAGLIDFNILKHRGKLVGFTNSGNLKGRDLTIDTTTFTDTGRIETDGTLKLTANNLTLNDLLSKGTTNFTVANNFTNTKKLDIANNALTLSANTVTNSGTIKSGTLSLTARTGALSNSGTIHTRGTSTINAAGALTNSGVITAIGTLGVTASGITNTNAASYIASSGSTTLNARGGSVSNSGSMSGGSSLVINNTNGVTNYSKITSNGSTTINGYVTNSGDLNGRTGVTINGGVNNSRSIHSNGALTIAAGAAAVTNRGNITSDRGNVNVTSSSLTNSGVLQAVGTLTTNQGDNIDNTGSIYGGTINMVTRGAITNGSRIIANNTLTLRATGDVTNKNHIGLVGRGTLSIMGQNIYNNREYEVTRVDRGNLPPNPEATWSTPPGPERKVVARPSLHYYVLTTHKKGYDDKLVRSGLITPSILSNGSMALNANNISNIGGVVSATRNIVVSGNQLDNKDVIVWRNIFNNPIDMHNEHIKRKKYGKVRWRYHGPDYIQRPIYFTQQEISRIPSIIQAGGAITGNLAAAVNPKIVVPAGIERFETPGDKFSSTSSGANKAAHAINAGAIGAATVGNYGVAAKAADSVISRNAAYVASLNRKNQQALSAKALDAPGMSLSNPVIGAIIPAAPTVSVAPNRIAERSERISAAELSLQRDRVRALADGINPNSGQASMGSSDLTDMARQIARSYESSSAASNLAAMQLGPVEDREAAAVIASADWTSPVANSNYYIKETSPVFTEASKYFSTDNFIKRMENFNPKKQHSAPRLHLGDSMKQMEFARAQIINLTGLASLDDSVGGLKEFQRLYDNGFKYAKEQKLNPGVVLSKAQIDSLRQDMIIPEEITLDGTKLIVPRVHLGKSKRVRKASGMVADTIAISASNINNNSSMIANDLLLEARDGNINNTGAGELYGAKHVGLFAAGDINNIGAKIESNGSMIISATNVNNIRNSKRIGDTKNHWTMLDKKASIKSHGMMALETLGNVNNLGSDIKSGDLMLDIGGSFRSEAVADSSAIDNTGRNSYYRERNVAYKPSIIEVAGNSYGAIAGDFNLIGSKMHSSGDSDIAVGGNSNIISQINSHSVEAYSSSTSSGTFGDTKHVYSHQSGSESLAESAITAGGKNTIINQGNQLLYGAKLYGGKGVRVKARKTSVLAVGLQNHSSTFKFDEGTLTDTTKQYGHHNKLQSYSSIGSGKGGEVSVESAQVSLDYNKGSRTKGSSIFGMHPLRTNVTKKPVWAEKLAASGTQQIAWNPLTESYESWNKSKTVLNKRGMVLVSVAVGAVTIMTGGLGAVAAPAASAGAAAGATTVATTTTLATMGAAMKTAAIVSVATQGTISMINNDFDLGKAAKETFSRDGIKSIAIGAVTAALTAGVLDKIGLAGPVAGTSIAERGLEVAKQSVVSAGVRTSIAGISGEDIGDIWKSAATSTVLATAQTAIGDIGIAKNLKEGSLAKIALHASTGSAISGAFGENAIAGAIGGAAGELIPSLMDSSNGNNGPPLTKEQAALHQSKISAITKLTATTAALLAGQGADGMGQAAEVAGSAVEYNRRLHPEELKILDQLKEGKTPEEQQRLTMAAASKVHASAGVNEKDASYGQIAESEVAGKFYAAELAMLEGAAKEAGKPDLFQYGWGDWGSDFGSRNSELGVRAAGGIKVGVGIAGAAGAAGIGALAAPATGGASGVLGAGVATGSLYYAADNYDQAFGTYQHSEGSSVIQSFNTPTGSFAKETSINAGQDLLGIVVVGGASKLVAKAAGTQIGQQLLGKVGAAAGKLVKNVAGNRGASVAKNISDVTIEISHNKGSLKGNIEKVKELNSLASAGKLQKTKVGDRKSALIKDYRKQLNKKIERQYGKKNPKFTQQLLNRMKKEIDIDHIHELQLGGMDVLSNLRIRERAVNRSIGSQIQGQIKKLQEGTKIDSVGIIKGK